MTADCSPMPGVAALAAAPGFAPAADAGSTYPGCAHKAQLPRGGPTTAAGNASTLASAGLPVAAGFAPATNTGPIQPNCAHKAPHPQRDPMTVAENASTLAFQPALLAATTVLAANTGLAPAAGTTTRTAHPSRIPGTVR